MNFLHECDCGDVILGAAVIQSAKAGRYYLKRTKPALWPLLRDLIANQPYIESFEQYDRQQIDVDLSTFRKGGIPYGVPLGELHSKWAAIPTDFSLPWLQAEPSPKSSGKIVISRTARYNNPTFPWGAMVEQLGDRMLFVGLPNEWRQLCAKTGRAIEYARTQTLWDVACLIAGSDLFIGNQSSPLAIAEGLKHPRIQETCLYVPDCIYPGNNSVHCFDGNLSFEYRGKRYDFGFTPSIPKVSTTDCPPGGYKVFLMNREYQSYSLQELENRMRALMGRVNSPANLREMILAYTGANLPIDAITDTQAQQMARVRKLVEATRAPRPPMIPLSTYPVPQERLGSLPFSESP